MGYIISCIREYITKQREYRQYKKDFRDELELAWEYHKDEM